MTTLSDCLYQAEAHWSGRPGGSKMAIFASRCVDLIGGDVEAEGLTQKDAISLLSNLRLGKGSRSGSGLSAKSVAVYYQAFRRMLTLNGVSSVGWPSAPTPPRKTREAMQHEHVQKLIQCLSNSGATATSDLATILAFTGMRIGIEGLNESSVEYSTGDTYDTLKVSGKGGHERAIPVVSREARDILGSPERMAAIRSVGYPKHLAAFRHCVAALGINSRLATPHSLRHYYACEALRKSGGNLTLVQELLGHSDPATTARYLSVDLSAKALALAKP